VRRGEEDPLARGGVADEAAIARAAGAAAAAQGGRRRRVGQGALCVGKSACEGFDGANLQSNLRALIQHPRIRDISGGYSGLADASSDKAPCAIYSLINYIHSLTISLMRESRRLVHCEPIFRSGSQLDLYSLISYIHSLTISTH
jgi:hypothetical protein